MTTPRYTVHMIDFYGRTIGGPLPFQRKREADSCYDKYAKEFQDGHLHRRVVEVVLYRGIDDEIINSTAYPVD